MKKQMLQCRFDRAVLLPYLLLATTLYCQAATHQRSASAVLSAQELFSQMAPSVLVIEALDSAGNVQAQGSAVAVSAKEIVTNKHVIAAGKAFVVRQGSREWTAVVANVDPQHDLCRLRIDGDLNARAVEIRRSASLQVGERVYAIGAPHGLELSLSEGIISALRRSQGAALIQTTTPISPGSSGGALFDSRGYLIGVTTFAIKDAQNLNFALPGDWVLELDRYSATSWSAPRADSSSILPSPGQTDDSATRNAVIARANAMLDAAAAAVRDKEFGQAIFILKAISDEHPEFDLVWFKLGDAYTFADEPLQGVNAYKMAIAIKPRVAAYHNNLGNVLARIGQVENAVLEFEAAAQADPANAANYQFNKGAVLKNAKRTAEANQAFDLVISIDPKFAKAYYYKAINLMTYAAFDRKTKKASLAPGTLEALRKYIELEPNGSNSETARTLLRDLQ